MAERTTLRERLEADLRTAMREKDVAAREAIRFLMAQLKNAEIEHRGPLDAAGELVVLQKQVKQRTESIEQFKAAGREDLVERETAQLKVIERYLPAQISDEELSAIVKQVIDEVGASSPKDMGKVMPVVLQRVSGQADGRRVSSVVKELLAGK